MSRKVRERLEEGASRRQELTNIACAAADEVCMRLNVSADVMFAATAALKLRELSTKVIRPTQLFVAMASAHPLFSRRGPRSPSGNCYPVPPGQPAADTARVSHRTKGEQAFAYCLVEERRVNEGGVLQAQRHPPRRWSCGGVAQDNWGVCFQFTRSSPTNGNPMAKKRKHTLRGCRFTSKQYYCVENASLQASHMRSLRNAES